MRMEIERSGVLIWIIGAETKDNVAVRSHHEGVPSHWNFWESTVVGVEACFFFRTDNGLESVAVKMEGMLAGIIAVEDNLDHLILLQHESIDVYPINNWVVG